MLHQDKRCLRNLPTKLSVLARPHFALEFQYVELQFTLYKLLHLVYCIQVSTFAGISEGFCYAEVI